jgi:hypothetical protein
MAKIISTVCIRVAFFTVKIRFFKPREEMERGYARRMKQFIRILAESYTKVPDKGTKINAVVNIFDLSLHSAPIVHKTIGKNRSSAYVHLYSKNGTTYGASYTISNSQFRFIIIKICIDLLTKHKCILLHASSIRIGDRVYAFTGDSGAGKSTIARILGVPYIPFSDELLVIQSAKYGYVAGQSFFAQKNKKIKLDTSLYPLHALFFIHQSKKTQLKKIPHTDFVLRKLLKQLRTDGANSTPQFENIAQFASVFRNFYDLYFEKKTKPLVDAFIGHNMLPVANNNRAR